MILNAKTRKQKLAAHRKINKLILALSLRHDKRFNSFLNNQYKQIAFQVGAGNNNISLSSDNNELGRTIKKMYTQTATVFNNEIFRLFEKSDFILIEQKSLLTEFWKKMRLWIKFNTAELVKNVQRVTKKKLKKIIKDGLDEGLSSTQIARIIRDKSKFNLLRAKKIARTEVHNASTAGIDFSMDTIAEQNVIEFIGEIVNAGDARVRGTKGKSKFNHNEWNGQRRLRGKPFTVSGELLMRPGDSSLGASIGNIVLCRCVKIYHIIRRKIRKAN